MRVVVAVVVAVVLPEVDAEVVRELEWVAVLVDVADEVGVDA